MNTPGGGKNDIPNRLKRHFCIFNVPLPSVAAINNIFGQLVAGRFASDVFSANVVAAAEKLVPITIDLWNKVQTKMLPTPAKFHYLFNMRELSKVFQGLILAERDRFKTRRAAPAVRRRTSSPPRGTWWRCGGTSASACSCDKLTTYEDKDWADSLIRRSSATRSARRSRSRLRSACTLWTFCGPPYRRGDGRDARRQPVFYESTVTRSIGEGRRG